MSNLPPSYNYDAFVKNAENLKTGKKSSTSFLNNDMFWSPGKDDEESYVRFLPINPPQEGGEFYIPYAVHSFNNQLYVCPRHTAGLPCPFCEWRYTIYQNAKKEGREKDLTPEELEAAKALKPWRYFVSPVIIRGEEEKGVRWYRYTKTIFDLMITWLTSVNKKTGQPQYGNIFDWQNGRDIIIKRQYKGQMVGNREIPTYSASTPDVNVSPVDTVEKMNEYWENMFDMATYLKNNILPYNKLVEIISNVNSQNSSEEYDDSNSDENDEISKMINLVDTDNPKALAALSDWQNSGGDMNYLREIVDKYGKNKKQVSAAPPPPQLQTPPTPPAPTLPKTETSEPQVNEYNNIEELLNKIKKETSKK